MVFFNTLYIIGVQGLIFGILSRAWSDTNPLTHMLAPLYAYSTAMMITNVLFVLIFI